MPLIAVLVGLVAGLFLWLPLTIVNAGIMLNVLHLPSTLSAEATLGVGACLYAIWVFLLWLVFSRFGRFGFFFVFLCTIPLPTLIINYDFQTKLDRDNGRRSIKTQQNYRFCLQTVSPMRQLI